MTIGFFDGAAELVGLIARLVRRPRGRDRALPMLCLVRSRAQADVLGGLLHERIVAATPRRVPNAYVDVERLDGARDVRALLIALCRQLGLDNHGFPPIEFRHFPLVVWLMDQDLGDVTVDQPAELVRRLRTRLGLSWLDVVSGAGAQATGGLTGFVAGLLRLLVPTAIFRARVSGRIPGLGREYRWCMRQRYVVPRLSATFPGFGVRLTRGHRRGEKLDQVDKLMVHAFLQDLRVAYARRPWRPGDWRHASYPIALLDDVSATNGGWALLRLVNEVRNETGQFDPLLVVAASEEVPDGIAAGSLDTARTAESGLQTWEQGLPEARRRLDRWGWYLPIRLPEPSGGPLRTLPIRPGSPPWWARRLLPAGLTVVLLVTAFGWGLVQHQQQLLLAHQHCGAVGLGPRVSVQLAEDGECVGFSDSASYVFQSEAKGGEAGLMLGLQHEIFSLNAEAERLHAAPENAGVPLVTLIYLAQLDIPVTNTAIVADEREELEGIAIRQRIVLDYERPLGAPLVRVILANAGSNMRYASRVAEMLRPLVTADPTIVGVLGFDESRTETVRAIQVLNTMGLPMIAPTLSADGLEQSSQLYFQIVPPNRQESEMMAQYAASRGLQRANILYTESAGDLYTTTLRADLAGARAGGSGPGILGAHGIAVDAVTDWQTPGTDLHALVCTYPGAVIYTGRAEDFDRFIHLVASTCGSTQPVNPIIGDDSVSRFMASATERRGASDYPLIYASKAGLTSCVQTGVNPVWAGFLKEVSQAPWYACGGPVSGLGPMGERVALAYDATDAFVRAVESLRGIPLSRGAIWQRLDSLKPFDGISGLVDFGSPVQVNHWIALAQVAHVDDAPSDPNDQPRVIFHCGWANSAAMTGGSPACTG